MTNNSEEVQEVTVESQSQEKSYFERRMELYGITPEINTVDIWRLEPDENKIYLKPYQVFQESPKGIDIIVYQLDRNLVTYKKQDSRYYKDFKITRLEHPMTDSKGGTRKYQLPKGAGTHPFIPPQLIKAFESDEEQIETLVLTEGYFKAFKAAMHGFSIIGLSSITHYKDKDSQSMHADVLTIMRKKAVKRVVWLVDGDCQNLSQKAIDKGEDIYKRPAQFFSSAKTIKQLLDTKEFENVEKIFAHVISDAHPENPKGLDDLLIEMKGREQEVLDDFNTWNRPSKYFHKIDMTYSLGKVHQYFHLKNVDDFIAFHIDRSKELAEALKTKEFVFLGTRYKWNSDKNQADITVPADAKKYFRVGDQYHEKILIPNKYNQMDHTFHRRMKSTIVDDYGKSIINHIPKYKAFCVVPDHQNFQEVIHSCYNLYAPFEHEPEEGECLVTIEFLKHIFGNKEISFRNPKNNEVQKITELDLGLDYIQLLYQRPTQTLPILCLVSKENATGKTTFAKWLKMIFTQNVAIVGNAELSDNFNASWASKLLVICDEAKIDKQVVVEKVKSLSTADKIFMNAKGKDHVEIDFFAKFMFLTNNEENFIYASEDDVRYWVRKVSKIETTNVGMLNEMQDEIGPFLYYLQKRTMKTECMHRAWFHPDLIKTDALKKVIAYSQSTLEKELRQSIRDMFLDFADLDIIEMTKKDIKDEFFRHKNYEMNYLESVIGDKLSVKKAAIYCKGENEKEYSSAEEFKAAYPDLNPSDYYRSAVKRYKYPRWEDKTVDGGKIDRIRVEVNRIGRPFIFKVTDFLLPSEISSRHISDPELSMVFGDQSNPSDLFNNEKEPF